MLTHLQIHKTGRGIFLGKEVFFWGKKKGSFVCFLRLSFNLVPSIELFSYADLFNPFSIVHWLFGFIQIFQQTVVGFVV